MASPPIRLLVTGGTFDKQYDELSGTLAFRETNVPQVLARGRCRLPLEVEVLMLKDSLDLTDADRARIVAAVQAAPERHLVITHGTDTMVESAQAIAAAALDKTVVLTGAMIPFAFGSSDGLFNLGSALSFAQVLPPGVYVAMNGTCFPWDNVRKNRELGVFEPREAPLR
jgi:L-asparaginase